MNNYENVMNNYESFRKDAKASIEKRKLKISDNERRNTLVAISIKGFQEVIDFNGTDDAELMAMFSHINVDEANSNHIISVFNQYRAITGREIG